ncbi:helix-turn-helix domain-containing protein [Nitrospira sp. Kam-Ns4a]
MGSTATGLTLDAAEEGDEVLTVLEVARFLRVPKSTVYKLARLGQLPASRIGKHWRFLRRDVRNWLRAQRTQP